MKSVNKNDVFDTNDVFISNDGNIRLRILNKTGEGIESDYYCVLESDGYYWNMYHSYNHIKTEYKTECKYLEVMMESSNKVAKEYTTETKFRLWLHDYIEQMEYEVQENEKEGYYYSESNGELECPEDYYDLGLSHGEQKGILDTLMIIKERFL